jgi:SAM-dependent methyltransferase
MLRQVSTSRDSTDPSDASSSSSDAARLAEISSGTLQHYQERTRSFFEGTRDHDVSQNIEALLDAIEGNGAKRILDLGCGPGRDLVAFKERGHDPVGLDGTEGFVRMARAQSGAEVRHQDFLRLDLATAEFDGVFANASLFHVPCSELPRVLGELLECLRPGGVLFSSNPRGENQEGWSRGRYGVFHDFDQWRGFVLDVGFEEIGHYYRPEGLPRDRQGWLATLWRRPAGS